jgi:hypothetical protein
VVTTVNIVGKFTGQEQINAALKGIERGLDNVEKEALSATQQLERVSAGLASAGQKFLAGVTLPIVGAATALSKFAIEAVESENLFETSMGNMADDARAFTEELSRDLGLNQFEMRRQIGVLFTMTQSMGIATDAAFSMSKGVALLAQDMASFRNIRPEEAFFKLQAALSGVSEPLKRLGINIQESAVEMEAFKLGIEVSSAKMTEQQKILLRWSAILRQTALDQGDLARTIESPANQLRILSSRFKESAPTLGIELLPAIQMVLKPIGDMAKSASEAIKQFKMLDAETKGMIFSGLALAAAIGPILLGLAGLIKVMLLVIAVFNSSVVIIGAVAAAIAGLSVLAIAMSRNWEAFVPTWEAIWLNIRKTLEEHLLAMNLRLAATFSLIPGFGSAFAEAARLTQESIEDIDKQLAALDAGASLGEAMAGLGDQVIKQMEPELNQIRDFTSDFFKRIGGEVVGFDFEDIRARAGAAVTVDETLKDAAKKAEEEVLRLFNAATGSATAVAAATKAATLELDKLNFAIESGSATLQDRLVLLAEMASRQKEGSAEQLALVKQMVATEEQIKRLAMERLDLEIKLGRKGIEARIEALDKQLQAEREGSIESLRILVQVQEAHADMAEAQIRAIEGTTDATRGEMEAQLQAALRTYEAMGEAGVAAAETIKEAIGELKRSAVDDMESIRTSAESAFDGINKSFGDAVAGAIVQGNSFKDSIKNIFEGIAEDIISSGVQSIIQDLFMPPAEGSQRARFPILDLLGGVLGGGQGGGQGGGGLGGLLGGLFGGGQAGGSTTPSFVGGDRAGGTGAGGAFASPGIQQALPALGPIGLAAAAALPFLPQIGDAVKGFAGGLTSIFEAGLPAIGGTLTTLAGGLQGLFSSGLGGIGDIFTSFLSGLGDLLGGFGGLGAGGLLGGLGGLFSSIGGLGSLFGGLFQTGGSFITQGPTLIGVGERGVERVSIQPLGGAHPSGGGNFVLQGPVFMDEVTMASFERFIGRANQRTAGRTI